MAFSSVRSFAVSTTAGSTGHAPTMPATIVAGDLIVAVAQMNTNGVISAFTGYTQKANSGTIRTLYVYGRVATGDANDTISADTDIVQGVAWVVIAIQDWEGSLAGIEASTTQSSNPPALAPSWGAEDTKWLAAGGASGGTLPAISAFPTNYTEVGQVTGNFGTDVAVGVGQRDLNVTDEDPGTFTWSGTPDFTRSATIAVRPAAGAQNIPVGQATEVESPNPITPLISREVSVGQTSEVETANAITPATARTVDVGQAVERELAQAITPVIGRMVPIGQATEVETGQPIAPLRGVAVGRASEVELARLVSPVKPIFVPLQTAVERELAQIITPTKQVPGQLGPAVCEVVNPSAECETFAL